MEIREAIVHGFEKEVKSHDVDFHPRDTNSSVDEMMQHLGEEVLKVYGRRSDSSGTFGDNETAYPFSGLLRSYHQQQNSLVDFSVTACDLIADQMRQSFLAMGGYAFLFVLRIKVRIGFWFSC